jgi:tRNA threonylcarbamoyl adenosine modification protein YeaZ
MSSAAPFSADRPVLALEASTRACGWAVRLPDGVIHAFSAEEGRASSVLPAALAESRALVGAPGTILVGVGPGSFGGIRVALALAEGLALPWGARVLPVRSSHAAAHAAGEEGLLGVFADAKRNQLFVTCYERGRMTEPSRVIERSELASWRGRCASAVSGEPLNGVPAVVTPLAENLIRYTLEHGVEAGLPAEPIHLRPPVPAAPAGA